MVYYLCDHKMKFLVVYWCLACVYSQCYSFVFSPISDSQSPVVETECGKIEGTFIDDEQSYEFRGIPYAEPPIGNLRWKPPVPVSREMGNCWDGTYAAKKFGNACFQPDFVNVSKYLGNEDCLYLNIWTPSLKPSSPLPVMFWIHGGFLVNGNGNDESSGYAPTSKLAHDTNIVYVSINYRLQAFGFMALEWLKEKSPYNTSGNYGFMDMIAGLQWVQRNIHFFGGDPNQVTVFGQSSGGTAIFALLASPLCKGLFHKAWLLSASPVMNKSATDAFKDNELFVKNTNCSNVDCLYSLSAQAITASVPWYEYPYWKMADLLGLPTKWHFDGAIAIVDGYVLKEAPFAAWVRGHGVDVPVVIGTTAQETDLFPVPDSVRNWTWTSGHYEQYIRSTLGRFGDVVANTALALYPQGYKTPEFQFTTMTSDLRVTCGNDILALTAASSFSSPVYRYVTTYCPSVPASLVGFNDPFKYSAHGIDIIAFYSAMDKIIKSPTRADLEWQSNVRKEILSFVKTGKPSSHDWLPYPQTTALLSVNTTVVDTYHATECEFWLANGFFSYSWVN